MKKIYFYLIPLLFILSCDEESNSVLPTDNFISDYILIVNEGLFNQNNSSITIFNNINEELLQDVYFNVNMKSLGDNGNNAAIFNDKIYIAVDNSNKIEVIDALSFVSIGRIDFGYLGSPREIAITSDTTGYVTSLYKDQLVKFNPTDLSISEVISIGKLPEGIAALNGKIVVCNSGFGESDSVTLIDESSFSVVKNIKVGFNPRFAKVYEDKFIIVCTGKYSGNTEGGVYVISDNFEVIDSVIMNNHPSEPAVINGKMLLATDEGVMELSLSPLSSPIKVINNLQINPISEIVYSIFNDENNNRILIGNPKNYTQNGELVFFDYNYNEIRRIKCGLNPGTILTYRRQ